MASIKELAKREDRFTGGHRACAGCSVPFIVRQILLAVKEPVVVTSATGCLEVFSTIFPYSSWKVPFLHSAFENSAATCSGVEAAYKSLKKQGKINKDIRFIAFGGDGGTYDIGLQSLSGALERRHRFLYVCYNNQAYMNTGIQRSGATPKGASTTTAPSGKVIPGKAQFSKDLTEIVSSHDIPYVAQTAAGFWNDLVTKVEKALSKDGPSFINVFAPCRLGWGYDPAITIDIGKMAAETCLWPLYEVDEGKYKINYRPKEKKPVEEFFKLQARFKHLFKAENKNIIEETQVHIDKKWEKLLKKSQG